MKILITGASSGIGAELARQYATKDNELILQCDESRSQHKNKELVIKRFFELIKKGLIVLKKRKPTKIPKSVIRKRLKTKKIRSDRKASRKKPDLD